LTRAATAATAQYGAGSPQAISAQAGVTAAKAMVTRVAIVKLQVSATEPQVPAGGWVLYGHVVDAQLQPVSGYTIFLVDTQKAYQSAYGFAYTDSTGYFVLTFDAAHAAAHAPGQKSAKSSAKAAAQLFVEIANAKGQPVYLDTTAFQPVTGTATYRNVTLPAGEPPIGDPPDAVRKTALPNLQ
jgi:hypothetical protein